LVILGDFGHFGRFWSFWAILVDLDDFGRFGRFWSFWAILAISEVFGLRIEVFGLRIEVFGLRIEVFGLRNFGLKRPNFGPIWGFWRRSKLPGFSRETEGTYSRKSIPARRLTNRTLCDLIFAHFREFPKILILGGVRNCRVFRAKRKGLTAEKVYQPED